MSVRDNDRVISVLGCLGLLEVKRLLNIASFSLFSCIILLFVCKTVYCVLRMSILSTLMIN